ncbi:Imm30 family immunity protein [Gorillibacterium sp. CAU 1737]|uniref:Imm30 family immunity protein n=1 Tax=Gorillibacterium sp. CAU 1737 TaxID=3140362 RepID=UPI0032608EDB
MGDLGQEAQRLYENRLMNTETEVRNFEEALEELYRSGNYRIIGGLCKAFDDQTEQDEVMWGLVHAIEAFDGEEACAELVKAMPEMLERANEWLKLLTRRILNHKDYRALYGATLSKADKRTKELLVALLNEIKDKNPTKYEASVLEVLMYLT